MSTCCIARECDKRFDCAHHVGPHEDLCVAVDWSTSGFGAASAGGITCTYDCGPASIPPYAKYEERKQLDDKC